MVNKLYNQIVEECDRSSNGEMRYPRSVQKFSMHNNKLLHPTQKNTDFLEFLIKTFTNEGEVVLDNCMGSASTIIACSNTNRKFIGIEKDDKYYEIAVNRVKEHEVIYER